MSLDQRRRRSTPRLSIASENKPRAGAHVSGHRSLSPPDIVEGSVDDLNRPLVRVELANFSDPLIAFIDTGFNGALLVDEPQAIKLGFAIFKHRAQVRLASQREENFLLSRGKVAWLGEMRS